MTPSAQRAQGSRAVEAPKYTAPVIHAAMKIATQTPVRATSAE
ncbi:hypothetical protein [Streptomyces sp. NPDC050548]